MQFASFPTVERDKVKNIKMQHLFELVYVVCILQSHWPQDLYVLIVNYYFMNIAAVV